MARHPSARKPNEEDILCTVISSMESSDKSEPPPINMMIDVSVNSENNIVHIFQPNYKVSVPFVCNTNEDKYWSPGYTSILTTSGTGKLELSQKETEEQKGEHVDVKTTQSQFQLSMSPMSSELNKKARTAEGLAYIFENWEMYSDKLVKAYGTVGFKERGKLFALMYLTVNLMKHKMKNKIGNLRTKLEDVETRDIDNDPLERATTTDLFARFFGVEPWEMSIQSLKDVTFKITKNTSSAQLGSFLVSVQNGDYYTTSIHLDLGVLSRPEMEPVVERLSNWFAVGNCEIYELKIESPTLHVIIQDSTNSTRLSTNYSKT